MPEHISLDGDADDGQCLDQMAQYMAGADQSTVSTGSEQSVRRVPDSRSLETRAATVRDLEAVPGISEARAKLLIAAAKALLTDPPADIILESAAGVFAASRSMTS